MPIEMVMDIFRSEKLNVPNGSVPQCTASTPVITPIIAGIIAGPLSYTQATITDATIATIIKVAGTHMTDVPDIAMMATKAITVMVDATATEAIIVMVGATATGTDAVMTDTTEVGTDGRATAETRTVVVKKGPAMVGARMDAVKNAPAMAEAVMAVAEIVRATVTENVAERNVTKNMRGANVGPNRPGSVQKYETHP